MAWSRGTIQGVLDSMIRHRFTAASMGVRTRFRTNVEKVVPDFALRATAGTIRSSKERRMVEEKGIARLRLGGYAIAFGGAASG